MNTRKTFNSFFQKKVIYMNVMRRMCIISPMKIRENLNSHKKLVCLSMGKSPSSPTSQHLKHQEGSGMMKCKSNHQPYPIYTTVLTGKNLPPHMGYRVGIPPRVFGLLENQPKEASPPPGTMKQKLIQTMFRESEAQTNPYEIDLIEGEHKGLEILTLGWLSWNNGLPAGMNEINTIERARQRRAWESALPVPFDQSSKEIRAMIIEAMEVNEWNYREQLIAAVGSLRMELAKKLMKERCSENKIKYEKRVTAYIQAKKEEKSKKLQKLRSNFNREIRKLNMARQKVNRKYHRWNIIKQFTDKTSEFYAPQKRFGEDPRHGHEKISPHCGYSKVFRKFQIMHQTVSDVPELSKPAFDFNKNSKPRGTSKKLCVRSIKWTVTDLQKLHQELRTIRRRRNVSPRPCYLKKKVLAQVAQKSEIPCVKGIPAEEEDMFQACLFLQRTIKGRAIQAVMFEGRVKCQELIEELKSTHALQNNMEDAKGEMRRKVYGLQRQVEIEQMQERRKNEILCALEGKTTGDMLDFLAKELLRLQDERMTHAMALAAEQERHRREAAEAGRRQVEEQRRREHDEMFKETVKVHQNVVQAFLEEFMIQNRNWLAHREAREHIAKIAKKIDQAAAETMTMPLFTRSDDLKEEEIIADLIHNFALPEAEKRLVRKRLNDRQRNYLRVCHDEVYSNIEKIVRGTRNEDGDLLPLPMKGKHKIPPIIRVKYLQLKRMHESSSSTLDSFNSQNSSNSVMNEFFSQQKKQELEQKLSQTQQQFLLADKEIWSSGFSRQEIILKSEENDLTKNNN